MAKTRIQKKNRDVIRQAALAVFSADGYRGATLDQIAATAGLSKPNLLYYFASKEAIYLDLLESLLDLWLDPLKALDASGDPVAEVQSYVARKLDLARDFPQESRLFANEILQGAPHIGPTLRGDLKSLVSEKCEILRGWMEAGQIATMPPEHLIFSIWALTQHYADFDVQVRAVLGPRDPYPEAAQFLDQLFAKTLKA